ncbi:hypothetical protein CTI12_AA298280 [Artemisia annua]|uniref:Uncharacterized protein n=1 Tax=Artemisia annua TaxID=35608 RepID=A0A2U1N6Y7_ARTAN|nr:hypothetical protein CTI12_AA298280 [Artemisia annua]
MIEETLKTEESDKRIAVLCAYIAPAATGSGIPEVKVYLNGIDACHIVAPSTLFVKIFGSIFGVVAGLVDLLWERKDQWDRKDLITYGAAGVVAAFRAPIGGVLFTLAEADSWSEGQMMKTVVYFNWRDIVVRRK